MTNIHWIEIANLDEYVRSVLLSEAPEIPLEVYADKSIVQQMMPMSEIKANPELIMEHDLDDVHLKRKFNFVERIKIGAPLLPLMVLMPDKKLIDGYARYRALKETGIDFASVILIS